MSLSRGLPCTFEPSTGWEAKKNVKGKSHEFIQLDQSHLSGVTATSLVWPFECIQTKYNDRFSSSFRLVMFQEYLLW